MEICIPPHTLAAELL